MEDSNLSKERKNEIFWELIDYISVHTDGDEEYYTALTEIIGLTDDEISELGIEVNTDIE